MNSITINLGWCPKYSTNDEINPDSIRTEENSIIKKEKIEVLDNKENIVKQNFISKKEPSNKINSKIENKIISNKTIENKVESKEKVKDKKVIPKKEQDKKKAKSSDKKKKTNNKKKPEPILKVKDIKICKYIKQRTPVGSDNVFTNNVDSLYCYTKIQNTGRKTEIRHIWYYEGQVMTQVRYNAKKSNNYRSWTKKTILPNQVGFWRVDIQNSKGTIIASKRFEIKKVQDNY